MKSDHRAILYVMLIIITLSAVFFLQTVTSYRQGVERSIQGNVDEARRITESNLQMATLLYETQMRHVVSLHVEILEPFARRDRKRLYEAALPEFEAMKNLYPDLCNMHFHLPDGRSFLRMHRPAEYGDDLTHIRPMIARIHQDHVGRNGFEIGVHGLFYRVATPVMYEGNYLGALEFGIRPDVLIKGIEAILGVDIAVYSLPGVQQSSGVSNFEGPPLTRPSGRSHTRSEAFANLPSEGIDRFTRRTVETSTGRFCIYRAADIRDFEGKPVGVLLVAQRIDRQMAEFHRLIAVSLLVTGWVVLAAYIVLRLSFGRMVQKILVLNRTLEHKVQERTTELVEQKRRAEAASTELSQIFDTAAGGLRVIGTDFRTLRVNKTFRNMIGVDEADIIGKPCYETFPGPHCQSESCPMRCILEGQERVEREMDKTRKDGTTVPCLLTATAWRAPDGELLGLIEDFTDLTTVRRLLDQQTINISLAQRILSFINSTGRRYVDLDDSISLFFQVVSSTCHAAGGDHCFVRQLPSDRNHPAGRTVLSLKDQSGHEVNCVLKSIVTDLIHNTILHSAKGQSLGHDITLLNKYLAGSALFAADEFVTAITVEIDHATGMLEYVSCGHPSFLVIRGTEIFSLPEEKGAGRHLPLVVNPDVDFRAGQFALKRGDKLIFYTDGLIEMPVSHLHERLTVEKLKGITRDVLREQASLPVSEIVNRILDTVARMSNEQVTPGAANTSRDDVTLVGLEVESQEADGERVLRVGSTAELAARVAEIATDIWAQASECRFELDLHRLRSVLDESVSNAWKHGNGCDAGKTITVRWRFRNDAQVEVIDEGSGFDYCHLEEPTEGENLLRDCGRGLFIVRLQADHVRWKDGGRRIVVSFRRSVGSERRRKRRVQRQCCLSIWDRDTGTGV